MTLLRDAEALLPRLVELRRRIHRRPELGLALPETQGLVVDELRALGLEPRLGRALGSVTALVGEDRPGRTVILRADMDALPLTEETGLEFASEVPGAMHACGHDMHVAMLLGAARLIVDRVRADPAALPGPALLMFQPGEEGHFGAPAMLEEGLLDGLNATTARGFAIHVSSLYPTGEVHSRPGAQQASVDEFSVTVRGRGGHAAIPHTTRDPIPVAAEIILALEVAVTRSVDVFDPVVLTVAQVSAGTTYNIVPELAYLQGTVRCVSERQRAAMPDLVHRVSAGVAAAHGVEVEVEYRNLYPVTVNDADVHAAAAQIASDLLGPAAVQTMPAPMMPGEDWSFVLQRIPGVMVNLGARPRELPLEGFPQNHSNRVVFDERAMAFGAALHAGVAFEL